MPESVIDPQVGQLTSRERFRRVMHYQSVDRVTHWEFLYWDETIERWHREGLPAELTQGWEVERFFGVEPTVTAPVHHGPNPPFEGKVEIIEQREHSRVERLPDGTVQEVGTGDIRTIPHYIKFPIENRDDWARYKERHDPADPVRFGADLAAFGREHLRSDVPVGVWIGSYYGIPRNWIGFENISLMVYDDREMIEDIVATLTEVYYRQIERVVEHVELDYAAGWEDICFRTGPMISPAMFREIVGPNLKRVCDLLRLHGCDVIWTDCDGDITDLVPVWLESGVNCMFPMEVHPGSDPVRYREMFGRQVLLRGGLDKQKLAGSRADILGELKRIEPVLLDGGFIPHCDHLVPVDVSYDNYRYYIREKLALLGWRSDEIAQVDGLRQWSVMNDGSTAAVCAAPCWSDTMTQSIIDRGIGELTHRERFRRCMHFQSVDRIPHWEFGYLDETIERWHAEGMPAEFDDIWKVEQYFGVDPVAGVPFVSGLVPDFEGGWEVLEETDKGRIVKLPDGTIQEEQTDGLKTIPHYLKFPIENRDDWERFRERLNPEDPRRFETDYEELGRQLLRDDRPVGIGLGSYFGIPRNWIGFENISLMIYDDRELVEEIVATLGQIYYRQIEEALKHVEVDFAGGWEDICFRAGPMLSPAMFREIVGPHLRRVCDLLRQHGCDVIWTDCDGDITDLVPVWLECGLNCMFPLEVHPGSDPVKYRGMWGRQVLLRGGVAKHQLAFGKEEILAELKRIAPTVEDGGFIPHGDHRIPQDVPYENYKYYIREKLALLGWRDDEVAQIDALR